MKDMKYYTPKALDLIAGMDCEILSDEGKWRKTNIANATQFGTILNLVIFLKSLRLGEVRVKYLDKDDIEDLGYKFNKLYGFDNGSHCIIDKGNNWYEIIEKHSEVPLFNGKLNNKSELKLIIKMLGI